MRLSPQAAQEMEFAQAIYEARTRRRALPQDPVTRPSRDRVVESSSWHGSYVQAQESRPWWVTNRTSPGWAMFFGIVGAYFTPVSLFLGAVSALLSVSSEPAMTALAPLLIILSLGLLAGGHWAFWGTRGFREIETASDELRLGASIVTVIGALVVFGAFCWLIIGVLVLLGALMVLSGDK